MKLNKTFTSLFTLSAVFLPALAFAQQQPLGNLSTLIDRFGEIIKALIPIMVGVAVVVFIYGVIRYVLAGGDGEKRKEGTKFMIAGIIGLFVIASLYGLIFVLQEAFGVQGGGSITPPTINGL